MRNLQKKFDVFMTAAKMQRPMYLRNTATYFTRNTSFCKKTSIYAGTQEGVDGWVLNGDI
ncbi:MAG: hypothetical protein GWP91_24625 [Rhodobacterales bacterium]|nr:hypothetical protein [Rhodobacterales bacterium]